MKEIEKKELDQKELELIEKVKEDAREILEEILDKANLKAGDVFVIGCSTSEIKGKYIGRGSDLNIALALYETIEPILREKGIYIAAQCCEHLNRAIILEREALLPGKEIVNVRPMIHAGGSFATTVYENLKDPVAVEHIKASAGIDIGETLIGMHLKDVAVPLRTKNRYIGDARVTAARTRPKFIGGSRAIYDESLIGGEVRR